MRRLYRVIALSLLLVLALPAALAETGGPPAFTLTRVLSAEYVPLDGWVAITYTARNNSEYPITSLTISDGLIGDIAQIDRLEPGESQAVVGRARIKRDCQSLPSARFALGGRMRTVSIAAADIRVEKIDLAATLTFESREESVLCLTVANDGNAPVYDVKAFDDALGDMGEAVERLAPGESVVFQRPAQGGRHRAHVTAVSAGGQAIAVESDEITGEHGEKPASDRPASLAVDSGAEGIFISLFNPGPDTWENVTLRELTTGAEQTFRFVEAGEAAEGASLRALWTPPANASAPFAFEATLPDGTVLTASLDAAPIPTAAPAPEGEKGVPALGGRSFRMDENPQTYRQMLYVTAVLMGLFLIVWWIIYHRRRRLARKKRIKQRQENRRKQQNRKSGEKAS